MDHWLASGPFPPAAAVLLVAALATGLGLALRPPPGEPALVVWTASAEQGERFEAAGRPESRKSVGVELMSARSLDLRLMTLLQAGRPSAELPDVVHLETLSASKFLEGGADGIGLLPLESLLASSGLAPRILPGTLAAWERDGHVYGVPLEVHPVTLTYRIDLFEAAGVDPATCRTWEELAEALGQYCNYWEGRGRPSRRGLELARTRSDHVTLMLQQRGVSLVGEDGRPALDDPRIVPTMVFYAELLAGDRPVAMATSEGHGRWVRDLARGDVAVIWTPGWRLAHLEAALPELSGKLAMMPLPRFEAADARTAVWGSAMLGIPRDTVDVQASWDLLAHLAFAGDRTVPLLPGEQRQPFLHDLYAGAPVSGLYAMLAAEARVEPVTPLGIAAAAHLAAIVTRAADARAAGVSGADLEAEVREWLAAAQKDLERRADFAAGAMP